MDGYSMATACEVLGVRYESAMPPLLDHVGYGVGGEVSGGDGGDNDGSGVELNGGHGGATGAIAATAAATAIPEPDFVAVDERRIFYAGDFCSRRPPGFEASALSGVDVAAHIRQLLCTVPPT